MDWVLVVSTVGGAAIALVGTVLADILRNRNDRDRDGRTERRQSYVDFVLALNGGHERLREVARAQPADLRGEAARAVRAVYEAREKLLMTAHRDIVTAGERAFQGLIRVRDVIRSGAALGDADYHDAYHAYSATVWHLRQQIRKDLGASSIAPEDLDRSAWDIQSECATCKARDLAKAAA